MGVKAAPGLPVLYLRRRAARPDPLLVRAAVAGLGVDVALPVAVEAKPRLGVDKFTVTAGAPRLPAAVVTLEGVCESFVVAVQALPGLHVPKRALGSGT